MRPIQEIAAGMGLSPEDIEPHGRYIAKVPLPSFSAQDQQTPLVVVTAITPTPSGEGKTTTAIGLADGLARIGKHPVLTLRQPSMGLLFGQKGGGTGGGEARVVPEAEINLHFTGDAHAVGAAHNLVAAMAEAAVHYRTLPDLEGSGLTWRRVTPIEDRGLRRILSGLGGQGNGPLRETGFDIDAASEIMAVLALATGYDDLRTRLGRMVIGRARDGSPVTVQDIQAVGALLALLFHAMKPNLAQTQEGNPVVVHTGPFGNIAHGCSSIVADRLAAACGDIVVTEAGFGADLGLEKLVHIKTRQGGHPPSAAVVVATLRALKWQGGALARSLAEKDTDALRRGLPVLQHAIAIVRMFGLSAVVAINRFPTDSPEELADVRHAAMDAGATAVSESLAFAQGGAGAVELAEAVVQASARPSTLTYLYPSDASIQEKVEVIARKVYLADGVRWSPEALSQATRYAESGWGNLPVCIAKTPFSLTADPDIKGVPKAYTFPVTGIRIAAGAGFVYPLAGDVQTLPGLPARSNAVRIDADSAGNIAGL